MVLEKGTFFGGRLDRLAGRMKKSAGNTCAVFLDTGAIIDFEREIERWKLKDSRVTPYDFYQDLTSRRMPLYVTVPICGEVLFHHKNHKLSGSPEISGETVELIMSMHQNYLDMLKRERVALRDSEQVGYDTYWASKMAFAEGHKKREMDPVSYADRDLVSSALWARYIRFPEEDQKVFFETTSREEKLNGLSGVVILSPDSHIERLVNVLTGKDFESRGAFDYNGLYTFSSR